MTMTKDERGDAARPLAKCQQASWPLLTTDRPYASVDKSDKGMRMLP